MRSLLRLLFLVPVLWLAAVHAADWPQWRGPQGDGRVAAPGIFEEQAAALDLAWRIPLGSGYSAVAVAGDRAVTLLADEQAQWAVAFDTRTGAELWRQRLGDLHKGRDGSNDGPLSSPTVGDGKVYALDPGGRLVALRLADGGVVWSKQLQQDFGSASPDFGYATSPLFEGGLLIVQAGGSEGRSIVALDANSGEPRWSHGDGKVDYQSPTAMTLAGRRQIVAISGKRIEGLAPETGALLWSHQLGESDWVGSANPTFIGEDRFLAFVAGDAAAFRVSREGEGFRVEPVYRSNALGQTYALPVYRDGHVYGFRGQVLTCIDAATGERVWRSRPPGGDGLILVEDKLVVFGAQGNVVVADATPEGYRERARLQALEGSGLTWPSFADGRIYLRNLDELAAVSVATAAAPTPAVVLSEPPSTEHGFGRWLHQLDAVTDREAMIDAWLARQETLPVVEGEWVHFVYRGEAKDVAIAGSMIGSDLVEPMRRAPGTDLFYRSYRLAREGRWEYRFQVDFENWTLDPLNTRKVPALDGDGEFSEVVAGGYSTPEYLAEPTGPRGRLDSFTLNSEILGYEKNIQVWLPPGYDGGQQVYPLLLVNDGKAWLEKGLLANSLDNLVGERVAPAVVAFVEPVRQWWIEAGGTRTDDYVRMLGEELMPALRTRYRLLDAPAAHAVMGTRFFGISAAYVALKYPQLFGRVGVQSAYLELGAGDALEALIRQQAGSGVRFYLEWNRWDERNIDRGYDFAEQSRELSAMLQQAGYTQQGGEVQDSFGWSGWRNRSDALLTALLPME